MPTKNNSEYYPDTFLRGLPNKEDYIKENGEPSAKIFSLDSGQEPIDNWYEFSINWEDDKSVLDFTLRQKMNKEIKYKGGVVRFIRKKIDNFMKEPPCQGYIDYNRKLDPSEENDFHENILFHVEARENKSLRRAVRGRLLKAYSKIIPNRYC